mmetsp:Transcript_17931/g.41475  ORF Transcript_17931/g.41475 Transcript_17931/m.41475 type:complete len:152 (-) Transcript_17931:1566-2021(-)
MEERYWRWLVFVHLFIQSSSSQATTTTRKTLDGRKSYIIQEAKGCHNPVCLLVWRILSTQIHTIYFYTQDQPDYIIVGASLPILRWTFSSSRLRVSVFRAMVVSMGCMFCFCKKSLFVAMDFRKRHRGEVFVWVTLPLLALTARYFEEVDE